MALLYPVKVISASSKKGLNYNNSSSLGAPSEVSVLPISLLVLSGICVLASLLPMVPITHGLIRIFDFARLQVIGLSLLVLGIVTLTEPGTPTGVLSLAIAGTALMLQIIFVLPFTPLWRKQTMDARSDPEKDATISLLTCNVKQGNQDHSRVADLVRERCPDIAIFMETDQVWARALAPSLAEFAEIVEHPLDNSYGIILASRFPLNDARVRFLLNDQVPSITCIAKLSNGDAVRIIALHPEPPVPTRDTMGRDAEIFVVGEEVREERRPVIVTGDLNDVAWSRSTRRFLRISRLLDPRQGRGFFNSFHAHYWFLRWPLDHIFHSTDFRLVTIERLREIGSDHFPMFYCFELVGAKFGTEPPPATEADFDEAKMAIDTEKKRDRDPAGSDWE
ncbi:MULTISPECIES: endonuclease/exonuclease/phosphatase family protein [unclassified Labrenzia]|uniref:endonuclease/exonuclease/phosphatase family protein n=1 Tax=unclassified Labrenzia TaxID=2648686 RepID=UPI00137866C3|nr:MULTISPECIES: endonuclease/exonuclease/phosphatase family protein [unclassified Labrenzia]